jgi:hypothetical protein
MSARYNRKRMNMKLMYVPTCIPLRMTALLKGALIEGTLSKNSTKRGLREILAGNAV